MNKHIKIIIFILFNVMLILAIQYILDTIYVRKSNQKFTKIFHHQIDKKIMIFGSSIAYHLFSPDIISTKTNMPTYNMGWDGIFFVQYNALLKEYISYAKECKYMVIACDFENLGKNKLISRPDLFYAYLNNTFVYQSLQEIEPNKVVLAKYLPGYKITLLNKTFYRTVFLPVTPISKDDGFDPVASDSFQVTVNEPFNARFEDQIYKEFSATIKEITEKGIKVIIVMTPVYKDGYQLILNANEIKNKYKSLTNKDVFFIDYTTDTICLNKNLFYNYAHLNSKGATVFSTMFADSLVKIIK